jgi:hypothetical protein
MLTSRRRSSSFYSYALRPILLSVIGLLALACGDSGGGGGGSAGTGSASVFLTDAASDKFDEILVTITGLQLIGNGRPVTIYTGRETVDLKDLENFSDLFVHADRVPAGTYNKIRMKVETVELVDEGVVIDVDPPANGKIDLLPREPFTVREGINLVIEIDLDAKKSIHLVKTGKRDTYRFRPVIFVTIRETRSPDKLARVHGEIVEIFDNGDFELCSTVFMAARTNSSREGDEEGGIGDRHRCMTVELEDATGVFDSNGDPVPADVLVVGDEVTVVGAFHLIDDNHDEMMADQFPAAAVKRHEEHHYELATMLSLDEDRKGRNKGDSDRDSDRDTDSDKDTDKDTDRDTDTDSDSDSDGGDRPRPPTPDIVFIAYVVEIGPPGTFLHLKGIIDSEVDDADEFDFAIDPGQGFGDGSIVTALLQDGTRIFSKRGVEVDESNITPDTRAKIDGVFATDELGTFYKTALLLLELEISGDTVLRGLILSSDEAAMQIVLDVDGAPECVDVPEETSIFLVSENEDGAISEEGSFEDLLPGLRTDVFGMYEEVGGCLVAETIIAFPVACDESSECLIDQYCAKPDGVCGESGQCLTAPEACTMIFDPVCGCDGVTYGNACVANLAGASVDVAGACDGGGPVACGGDLGTDCLEGEICVVEAGLCDPGAPGICEPVPEACPAIVDPVCGCDGKTFTNACEARRAGVTVDFEGSCGESAGCGGVFEKGCSEGEICLIGGQTCDPAAEGKCVSAPETCSDEFAPVCGCDDVTYDNACSAALSEAPVAYEGECADDADLCGGDDELACMEGDLCLRKIGSCESTDVGVCIGTPMECPKGIELVCGCDDVTYDNACRAYQAGVSVAAAGACDAGPPGLCGGLGGDICGPNELCLIEAGLCDPTAAGKCVPDVVSCDKSPVKPVCGCDGTTYRNLCEATRAGAVVAGDGSCAVPNPVPAE